MNEAQQQATNHLITIMQDAGEGNPRVMQLAMQWPSLAAALANLLLAHDLQPAPPLRRAAREVAPPGHHLDPEPHWECP